MSGAPLLSRLLRRSAASTGGRGGRTVPLHFGSAAGELALCMRSVGLVHREDLMVLAVLGDEPALEQCLADSLGTALEVGGAATRGGIYWARNRVDELLAVGTPERLLSLHLLPPSSGEVRSEALDLTTIGLVGPSTAELLLEIGAAGGDGTWILLDDRFALALVEPARAVALWHRLTTAGRRFGLGYVGAEAAERFELTRCGTAPPRRALS